MLTNQHKLPMRSAYIYQKLVLYLAHPYSEKRKCMHLKIYIYSHIKYSFSNTLDILSLSIYSLHYYSIYSKICQSRKCIYRQHTNSKSCRYSAVPNSNQQSTQKNTLQSYAKPFFFFFFFFAWGNNNIQFFCLIVNI